MAHLDVTSGDSLTFVGTATVVLRLGPFTLLTDPNFLHRGQWSYFGQGLFSRRRTEPALQPADLPPLTAVVLSHLHGDHFDRIAARELPRDVPIVTTAHAAGWLQRKGFHAPLPLAMWRAESFADGDARLTVTSVPARHGPGVLNRVLPPVMGSVLEYRATPESDVLRIYLSGDTVLHDELGEIRARFPELDLAVVHLGGTRAFGVLVTLDHRGGVDLLNLLEPRRAVPVHFDDYGLFHSPVSSFLQEVRERKPPTEVCLLQHGESLPL
ncbi:MBL fold metallo-hydrolase [Amycolatopsis sp., V23-08]|uniref:MBL fold metallo-hydrolase n=1 Tax=Amycolatopsis heterodermiae TaxID=3110235 RepID=A0ABU5RI35_9PSEU|nr:MBL fold metallo-hydrolase [Amycolatopsis sp., V23-08]MEA5365245.1 MBL fold metallo-hydrolase [Amycolatopsis sp., V23-08]